MKTMEAELVLHADQGSSSTTLRTLHIWVPRFLVRLVVDYFASRRLVVDYFAYATRPGASTRHVSSCG
jgi:hypothetical protein